MSDEINKAYDAIVSKPKDWLVFFDGEIMIDPDNNTHMSPKLWKAFTDNALINK